MFKSARLKLTAWYLLIIMLISVSFSVVIYVGVARELQTGFRRAEIRLRAEELGIPLPRHFSTRPEDLPARLRETSPRLWLVEDTEATKKRLVLNLLLVNATILVFSAGAGYFLAGKTLAPIEKVLEEQKRFVADASHELRTPLTALKTSMEVALKDKKLNPTQAKQLIKENLKEVEGLISLSNNLLSLARYQGSSQRLIFEKIEMQTLVKEALKRVSPLAKKKGIKIISKLKEAKISANSDSLQEMLLIFLDNAVKYTPRGGKITLRGERKKKYFVLAIADTGVGIAEKDLPYIFDRFYRADASRARAHLRGGPPNRRDSSDGGGFGLGLSLAKRIIELHKGSVAVKSQLNKGTTFTIKLPL